MMMIDIKEAKDRDTIEAIAKLAHSIWHEYYTPITGNAQVDYMLEKFQSARAIKDQIDEGYRYFAAYTKEDPSDKESPIYTSGEETPIGYFAVLSEKEDNSLFISKFYIAKDYRGKGIARLFLNHMENIAQDESLDKLWLTVNKQNLGSIAVYESMGFRKTKDLVQDIGSGFVMDDYRMEKNLG